MPVRVDERDERSVRSRALHAAARMFGWDGNGKATVTVNADKALILCDETRRAQLIAQRQRLLEAEKPVPGRAVEVLTAARQETQPDTFAKPHDAFGTLC